MGKPFVMAVDHVQVRCLRTKDITYMRENHIHYMRVYMQEGEKERRREKTVVGA